MGIAGGRLSRRRWPTNCTTRWCQGLEADWRWSGAAALAADARLHARGGLHAAQHDAHLACLH
eukprot:scaffold34254_cov65-Phaeocystis_antarctica.AAC.7